MLGKGVFVTLFFMFVGKTTLLFRYINMKILTTSDAQQNITIIPRQFLSSYKLIVKDEATNTEVFNDEVTAAANDNYRRLQVTFDPVLKEGHSYTFEVRNRLVETQLYYRGKIFCTDQTVNQSNNDYYDINKDVYDFDDTSGSHDNDYIII